MNGVGEIVHVRGMLDVLLLPMSFNEGQQPIEEYEEEPKPTHESVGKREGGGGGQDA